MSNAEKIDEYSTQTKTLTDGTKLYVGNAKSGIPTSEPFWTILRIETTGTDMEIKYAEGVLNPRFKFDDCKSLSYK